MECDIFPFRTLTLLVGRQEGHPARKKTMCCFIGRLIPLFLHVNGHFPGGRGLSGTINVFILDFIGAKDDASGE